MTLIVDYATLQTEVGNWLNRVDLAPNIPSFINLAEATIKRRLRDQTLRATITVAAESTQLPSDVAELRSLRLITGQAQLDTAINICTPEILSDFRALTNNVAGRPRYAAIIGTNLVVVPQPDTSYNVDITYYARLTPLSSTNTTNILLTNSPDVYLYGALLQAEAFLEHDERVPMWKAGFDAAIAELEEARTRREFSASIAPVRLKRSF